jgi:hypothetical protein
MPSTHSNAARLVVAGWLASTACTSPRPFAEADWGTAPAPYAAEVTEITLEHQVCRPAAAACTTEHLQLRRDGRASREFRTGRRMDSLLTGSVDSSAFADLSARLAATDFFTRSGTGARHEPLATDSYVASVASLCRRAVQSFSLRDYGGRAPAEAIALIERTGAQVSWARCCSARR